MPPLVRVEGVDKTFRRDGGPPVYAVDEVSFEISPGETLALIGESGSGKSTVGRLVLGLIDPDAGTVEFEGRNINGISSSELRATRSRMQVVFQEPYESLNPRMRIGAIVEEPLVVHNKTLSKGERRERVLETFEAVHLDAEFADRFPAALSGGQQQRVGIARAVVTRPSFIVLDEPTSSLDLSVRAQILNLLGELQNEFNLAYLFISHDISTVEYFSDRVAVMYRGQIVESGNTDDVIDDPQHPYTAALLSAALSVNPTEHQEHFPLEGSIPSNTELATGCVLAGRCPIEIPECSQERVPLESTATDRRVRCIRVTSGPLQARLPIGASQGPDRAAAESNADPKSGEPGSAE